MTSNTNGKQIHSITAIGAIGWNLIWLLLCVFLALYPAFLLSYWNIREAAFSEMVLRTAFLGGIGSIFALLYDLARCAVKGSSILNASQLSFLKPFRGMLAGFLVGLVIYLTMPIWDFLSLPLWPPDNEEIMQLALVYMVALAGGYNEHEIFGMVRMLLGNISKSLDVEGG